MRRKIEVHPGDVYGKLTIIKEVETYVDSSGKKHRMVLVQCSCGSEPIEVRLSNLRSGHTSSCGCYNKDRTKETHKKYNTYDLSGEYGKGYTSKGEEFLFDLEDFDKIKDYCWYICNGYVVTKPKEGLVSMHRLVMDAEEGLDIDHMFRKKNDNRKSQLRAVTESQNNMNQGLSKSNTSGVRGVCFNKRNNKWRAYISINYKRIELGNYESKEEAIKVRLKAEQEYFGEFGCNYNKTVNE